MTSQNSKRVAFTQGAMCSCALMACYYLLILKATILLRAANCGSWISRPKIITGCQ